jgi:hypothetical protein
MIRVGSFKKLGLLSYHGLSWLLGKRVDCTLQGARYVCRHKERENYLLCKHARHKKVEMDVPLDVKKKD